MKTYSIKTESGPIHRDHAESFDALRARIEAYPPEALPSLLGESYNGNGRDWWVTACKLDRYGKPTNSQRKLLIRIDGLGKVECSHA